LDDVGLDANNHSGWLVESICHDDIINKNKYVSMYKVGMAMGRGGAGTDFAFPKPKLI
jgi:hypothetical protein